jgi:hypothetical protein
LRVNVISGRAIIHILFRRDCGEDIVAATLIGGRNLWCFPTFFPAPSVARRYAHPRFVLKSSFGVELVRQTLNAWEFSLQKIPEFPLDLAP